MAGICWSSECKRLRAVLIEVYMIMRSTHSLLLGVEDSKTRGHKLKARERRF